MAWRCLVFIEMFMDHNNTMLNMKFRVQTSFRFFQCDLCVINIYVVLSHRMLLPIPKRTHRSHQPEQFFCWWKIETVDCRACAHRARRAVALRMLVAERMLSERRCVLWSRTCAPILTRPTHINGMIVKDDRVFERRWSVQNKPIFVRSFIV